jgi:hypothetical protein
MKHPNTEKHKNPTQWAFSDQYLTGVLRISKSLGYEMRNNMAIPNQLTLAKTAMTRFIVVIS